MDDANESTPLFRLKVQIWIHAAIGALLLLGLPAVALATEYKEAAIGVVPALFIWSCGIAPLRKKASQLGPTDRAEPKGLPSEIPLLVGIGGFVSPFWLASPLCGWVVAAWVLLFGTIALRWMISRGLAVPVHRRTWAGMLVALSTPLIWILPFLLLYYCVGME